MEQLLEKVESRREIEELTGEGGVESLSWQFEKQKLSNFFLFHWRYLKYTNDLSGDAGRF